MDHRPGLVQPTGDHVPNSLLPHANSPAGQGRVNVQRHKLRAQQRGDQHVTRVNCDVGAVRTQQLDCGPVELLTKFVPRPVAVRSSEIPGRERHKRNIVGVDKFQEPVGALCLAFHTVDKNECNLNRQITRFNCVQRRF